MIQAKTVIPNQFWILRDRDRKVGNIEATAQGFRLELNDRVSLVQDRRALRRQGIEFIAPEPRVRPRDQPTNQIMGWPTASRPYNAVWNVQLRTAMWTEAPRSRSWRAAGWWIIRQGRAHRLVFCPKIIVLERYAAQGPYRSQQEAEHASPA